MGVRRPSWTAAGVGALLAALLSAGVPARPQAADTAASARLPTKRLYSERSPFNRRIPARPRLDRDSARMIAGLGRSVLEGGATLAWRQYTVPLFMASRNTPRRRVRLTASWRPRRALAGVPLPRNAAPDPSEDGHLAVIDRSTGCEYDFWRFRRRGRRWQASWGNAISARGSGIYPRGYSARGSGFALMAGVVLPAELERGRIDHALLLSYPYTRARGPVRPATESDGRTRGRGAIPEGARLQLDPSVDLDALGLSGYERTIARALQVYGAYVGDTAGRGVTLYAVHPTSTRRNPYGSIIPDEEYPSLDGIPFESMRVLRLGERHRGRPRIRTDGCARFVR
ncbi:MAG TPA: hypothetical protein VFQ12_11690 [Thermoleophilaceae bacterium]|nr:hypothetical protein [Thermoleophilaceae bacterium]